MGPLMDADAVDDDRPLLVRQTYGNQWDIPGGHVDVGESPAAACQRELREELGIDRSPSGSWSWSGRPSTRRR